MDNPKPDHVFKCFLDKHGDSWIAGVLFKCRLSEEDHDRIASFMNYGGGIGRPFQNYSHTKKTRNCTLILARGGWDV